MFAWSKQYKPSTFCLTMPEKNAGLHQSRFHKIVSLMSRVSHVLCAATPFAEPYVACDIAKRISLSAVHQYATRKVGLSSGRERRRS